MLTFIAILCACLYYGDRKLIKTNICTVHIDYTPTNTRAGSCITGTLRIQY